MTLIFITLSQAKYGKFPGSDPQVTPELFTNISNLLERFFKSFTSKSIPSSVSKLLGKNSTCSVGLALLISLQAATIFSIFRLVIKTLAPASDNTFDICRPIPLPPPVTSAVLP